MNIAIVAADVTKWIAWGPGKVTHIYGFNNQIVDLFIQLFQSPTVAASDVPAIKALWAPSKAAFDWPFPDGLQFSELLVAPSSSEANYTAVGAGAGLDMTVVIETDFLVDATITVAGDLTTGVASRQIWAEASGPKRLLRLDVKNNVGATAYAHISSLDAPSTTDNRPEPLKVLNATTKNFWFGKAGLVPGLLNNGCTIKMADGATVPYTFTGTSSFNIRAIYA